MRRIRCGLLIEFALQIVAQLFDALRERERGRERNTETGEE